MSVVIPVNTASYDAVSRRMQSEAAARPPPPAPAALVRCPWCSETVEPRVAGIAGWVRATLDGAEVRFSSQTCMRLYNARARRR